MKYKRKGRCLIMAENRIYNFSAGPSMLPLEVLKKAQSQMLNYEESGMSVMEMSHRSKAYDAIITKTQERMRSIMNIPDNYKVLFLQGGATSQFSMVPLNLLQKGTADYIVTGYFANKAYAEAKKYGEIVLAGSSKDADYSYIPAQQELQLNKDADYVYLCANNTIYGTEWKYVPETNGVPIVADMSSDILSKPVDVSKFGIIFAGAQKNMGCAGLTVAIVREDLIGHAKDFTPVMMDYAPLATRIPCTTHRRPMQFIFWGWCWNGLNKWADSRSCRSEMKKRRSCCMTIWITVLSIQPPYAGRIAL